MERPELKRILIIDDNQDAAELTAQLLELHGYRTAVAFGGREGVKTALEFIPDVLLLDLGMPDLDGYAVARMLRAERQMHSVVVIACTAWGDVDTRAKTAASGFDHHVV